jgi:hypothetical protein
MRRAGISAVTVAIDGGLNLDIQEWSLGSYWCDRESPTFFMDHGQSIEALRGVGEPGECGAPSNAFDFPGADGPESELAPADFSAGSANRRA